LTNRCDWTFAKEKKKRKKKKRSHIYVFIYKIALSLEQNFQLLFKKVSGIYQIACISIELGVLIALL
jgi:hypothetical protein